MGCHIATEKLITNESPPQNRAVEIKGNYN